MSGAMESAGSNPERAGTARAWRRAPEALSARLPDLLGPLLRRRGFAQGQILARWPAIVGPLLARHTAPERLIFAAREHAGATLRVRVAPGFAPQIQHLEPLLVQRINTFYGYRAVARLRLIQGPLPPVRETAPPVAPPPSPAEAAAIEQALSGIAAGPLREALARLGLSLRRGGVPGPGATSF